MNSAMKAGTATPEILQRARRPGTATATRASTTGSKLAYTLAGDSSPDTPP